jgi:TolB-like protein
MRSLALLLLPWPSVALAELRVAVLYFDNNTSDRDFELLKKGMADMLITDLSRLGGLEVVERERLEALLAEMKLQRSKYFDQKTALALGKGMGASHAVTGAFSGVGGKIRIDVRLIEIGTAKIVAADKVVGAKDDFFDLEQKLVVAFSCALSPPACKEQEATGSEGQAPVKTILEYARGLELADGGNLEAASSALRGVMSEAPSFTPARTRYLEIMKRLYAAKRVRTGELSENEKRLLAKVGRELGTRDPSRRLGYRILNGQLILHRIDALFSDLAERDATAGAAEDRRFSELVAAYEKNQLELLAELEGITKKDPNAEVPEPAIDEVDRKAGSELGLGDEPGNLDFISTIQVRRDLGSFLTTGAEPFWGTFRWSDAIGRFHSVTIDSGVRVRGKIEHRTVARPPMMRLDPSVPKRGLTYFAAALADASRLTDGEARTTESIRVLDAEGEALRQLGRLEDAIAKWQTILERWPKHEDYAELEEKIRKALE